MTLIDPRLVLRALPEVDTWAFEKFGQTFYGALQDREFVPLGGMHDGGAEGFDSTSAELEPEVFFEEETSSFLQISKEATTRSKIRRTVKRLREYGRAPKVLTYLSSQVIPDIDKEEKLLSDELGCKIRIRDAAFIEVNINASQSIQAAFQAYLEPAIAYLYKPGTADVGERTEEYVDRTLAVFLRQEVDNRRDKSGLLESIADSLILWALGDTDPDKRILMSRAQILARIEETLPAARQFIRGVLDDRLNRMVSKDAPGGRQIRWYRRDDKFCLPYETRVIVAVENADDDLLKSEVSAVLTERLKSIAEEGVDAITDAVVATCHSSLERVFERQGLQMARFVTDGDGDDELYTDVAQIVSKEVDRLNYTAADKGKIRRYCLMILRGTFYKASEAEREYLSKLSKTYILLLTLKNEPKIVEYFRTLAKSFRLYIGTDFIIRSISEQYLPQADRTTSNLLDILRAAGSELILTEKVVEEVETHLRAQILEFENHYAAVEHKIPFELVGYIDRILIRAYLYSKLSPAEGIAPPESWRSYIGQFANFGDVRSLRARSQLAGYFTRRFKMTYETTEEMVAGIDQSELEILTERIYETKKASGNVKVEGRLLAYNDALHILRVFRRRVEAKENSPGNQWGFQTWWLTQDGKVRRAGALASAARGGAHFMMRPEFLLSNISFAPELKEVRDSFEKIFPSVLGVRLSARLSPGVFESVMDQAKEVSAYDDARAGTLITELTNKLKGDALRLYEVGWNEQV
ncbi:hypothetical protein PH547_11095 [Rhizobium sp. CNPSo 3464]|uniref:hypothetical protein n=1 Tax=Rhizobium sp. CNPSo 3464 TaxID=3021406 RepID=UPI00254F337A|nr:hypothetical protein [Rhizobium sp. CNPSo 3464]MDK4739419.1 hypothetical protein [Rhizobium sp. CNPSo 3464]